jgi:hypothetical protein
MITMTSRIGGAEHGQQAFAHRRLDLLPFAADLDLLPFVPGVGEGSRLVEEDVLFRNPLQGNCTVRRTMSKMILLITCNRKAKSLCGRPVKFGGWQTAEYIKPWRSPDHYPFTIHLIVESTSIGNVPPQLVPKKARMLPSQGCGSAFMRATPRKRDVTGNEKNRKTALRPRKSNQNLGIHFH